MQVDELPAIDPNVDYTQILPIQQKRTIAFVNHFLMNTVSYLNNFAQSCESRLMEFEYKLQKVEAALLILESQLTSISGLEATENAALESKPNESNSSTIEPVSDVQTGADVSEESDKGEVPKITAELPEVTEEVVDSGGCKASEDPRFKKFFKMVQFGVPESAVKLKMKSEGVDPNILSTPNAVIPGFIPQEKSDSDDNSSD